MFQLFLKQLLDELEQNIAICQWRADQLFTEADKSRYFTITEFNNCLSFRSITEFVFHNYFREGGSAHCLAEVIAEVDNDRPSGHNYVCTQTAMRKSRSRATLFADHELDSRPMKQSRSQCPRYPCPGIFLSTGGAANKELWGEAIRHEWIIGLPALLRMCSTPWTPRFLDFRSYCANQADDSIPEVLVGGSTRRWIRVTRTRKRYVIQ